MCQVISNNRRITEEMAQAITRELNVNVGRVRGTLVRHFGPEPPHDLELVVRAHGIWFSCYEFQEGGCHVAVWPSTHAPDADGRC
jgi:hypothetical protein